jgi:hypothetical protein
MLRERQVESEIGGEEGEGERKRERYAYCSVNRDFSCGKDNTMKPKTIPPRTSHMGPNNLRGRPHGIMGYMLIRRERRQLFLEIANYYCI